MQSKEFFEGPVENKRMCPTRNNRGWVSMQQETLDPGNQKVGRLKILKPIAQWYTDLKLTQILAR